VAYARRPIDDNAERGIVVGVKARAELESLAVERLRATSIVKGLIDAIVWVLVAKCFEEVRSFLEFDLWWRFQAHNPRDMIGLFTMVLNEPPMT